MYYNYNVHSVLSTNRVHWELAAYHFTDHRYGVPVRMWSRPDEALRGTESHIDLGMAQRSPLNQASKMLLMYLTTNPLHD